MARSIVLFALLFLWAVDAQAQEVYSIGRAPAWVTNVAADLNEAPPAAASSGFYYYVVDEQVLVSGREPVAYSRYVVKVLNQEGIGEASSFSVDVDPEYERLTLHGATVYRYGTVRDALDPGNITVLQRERALERRIYDGRKTVDVVIEDLRVGDVVEYSYSVRGANPIFDGRFAHSFLTQFSVPIHRFQYRLLWQADRELQFKRHAGAPEPVVSEAGGLREYLWRIDALPALTSDGDTPSWFDPYPWVAVSEWADWTNVVAWALPMYENAPADVPLVDSATPEERLLAALRFVQDEVRYLGVEMGRGSHEPRTPAVVLRTRFGDCKDKSRLLVSLLATHGIEAYPALVHTIRGKVLPEQLPSPTAFDHVIVAAHLNGRRYWLDPTMDHQRGSLDRIYQPDYGHALVVRPGVTELVAMNPPRREGADREIDVTLKVAADLTEASEYSVRTIYYGAAADDTRRQIAAQTTGEIEKAYLNYYASNYPAIEIADSIRFYDDEGLNRLIVDESYDIPDVWTHSETHRRSTFSIHVTEMQELLYRPRTSRRTMPLAVAHPYRAVQTVTVILPEHWDITPEHVEIADDPGIRFVTDVSYGNEVLTLRFEYESKADHVLPEHAAEHLRNVDAIYESLRYEIYRYDGVQAGGINWLLLPLAFLTLLLATAAALKAYCYEPDAAPLAEEERDPRLSGIGGWLILVAIGVVVAPIRIFKAGVEVLSSANAATWSTVTDPGSPVYHVMWAPTLAFEVVANSTLFVFAILVAVLFLQRRQSLPRVFTVYLAASAVLTVVDTSLLSTLPAADVGTREIVATVRDVISSGVWMAYLHMSKRVESTFVRRWSTGEVPAVGFDVGVVGRAGG